MSKKEKLLASAQKSLQKGQIAKAIKDYQQILQISSGDVRSRQKLAELLGRDGRTEEALGEYEAVAKHYAKTGFYLKAIAVYKQMQKLDPSKVDFYHHLAELNEKQGLVGNALAEYRNLVAHYEKQKMYTEAAGVLQKMRELEPENLNILVKIGETYAKGGLRDRALEEFGQALGILRQKEDFSRALKLYEIFLPLYPDQPEMQIGMAQALIEKGDAEKGIHTLKNLLQKDPEQPQILTILAQGYRKLEDYVNERLTYQHLLRNASDDLELRQCYIRSCIDSGETTRAFEDLEAFREAFLAADKANILHGFYEKLKQLLPQDDQVRRSLHSVYEITGDEEMHSADLSGLLGETEPEEQGPDEKDTAGDKAVAAAADSTEEPIEKAREDAAEAGVPEEEPAKFSLAAEDRGELEIPLEFLEDVAGEVSGEEPESAAAKEPVDAFAEPFSEEGLELELELELDPEESFEGLKLDLEESPNDLRAAPEDALSSIEMLDPRSSKAGQTDEPLRDSALPDEDILELDLEDALVPDDLPEVEIADDDEEILDLGLADVVEADSTSILSTVDLRSDLEEAEFYLQQGLLEDAERTCRSLLEKHPNSQEVLNKISEIEKRLQAATTAGHLFDLEELAGEDLSVLEGAIDDFADSQRGIETPIDVEDTESHYNLGIAYKEMGLLEEAVAEFDKAVSNPARRVGCLTLKGICLVEKGSFELAEDAFKSAMAHPGLSEGERTSLLYELGLLYEGWNKLLEALDCFQTVADADLFFRDVVEKVADLRKKLGMDAGEGESESGPRGDKDRVSYV